MGFPDLLPCVNFPFTSGALGGERVFSLSTENILVPVTGAPGFPAVDVWIVPRLDSIEEPDFKNFTLFFLEADEGVAHSLDLDDILISCEVHGYRCRLVDANVNRVLPREVAQAVMVPTTLVSWTFVQRCRQGAASSWTRFYLCLSG